VDVNQFKNRLKLMRSTDSFCRDLKTFLFHSVYGNQDTDWLCDAPSVFYYGSAIQVPLHKFWQRYGH